MAIYEFDAQLKALFYPCVMKFETAIKNYVLEVIVQESESDSFPVIYSAILDNYKSFSVKGKSFDKEESRENAENRYKKELKKRLDLRNRIYKVQTDEYGKNKIVDHFLSDDRNIPIWAIFELLSLGEFGMFVSCINKECREKISKQLGINPGDDNGALMPQKLIYATKDLRNAIAHDAVIFDARFKTNNISKKMCNAISGASGVKNLTFDTITDYLVLIVYELKLIGVTKTELKRIVSNYNDIVSKLWGEIPFSIFSQIIHTDNCQKIERLTRYISV